MLEESDGVYEKGAINSIDLIAGQARIHERYPIDSIARHWVLVLWFRDDSRDIKVLGIQ